MTREEAQRLSRQDATLAELGFTPTEADALRRISMTLHRWYEHECNGDIQRDETTGVCYHHYDRGTSGPYRTTRAADRETGAIKRLQAIMTARNRRMLVQLTYYLQTDPRGAALYILRPGDVPEGQDPAAYYSRGICIY